MQPSSLLFYTMLLTDSNGEVIQEGDFIVHSDGKRGQLQHDIRRHSPFDWTILYDGLSSLVPVGPWLYPFRKWKDSNDKQHNSDANGLSALEFD